MKLNFSRRADEPRKRISSCEKSGCERWHELNVGGNVSGVTIESAVSKMSRYIICICVRLLNFLVRIFLKFYFFRIASSSALTFINYKKDKFLGIEISPHRGSLMESWKFPRLFFPSLFRRHLN